MICQSFLYEWPIPYIIFSELKNIEKKKKGKSIRNWLSTCQPFVKELFWYYLQVDFLFNISYWLSYCFYCFMISVCITVLSVKTNACCYLQRLYIWLRTKHVYLSYCNDYYFIAKKIILKNWYVKIEKLTISSVIYK